MDQQTRNDARILIADDESANVRLLERMLARAGYADLRSTTDATQVRDLFTEFHPDLLLLDLHMPVLDGFAVMEQIRSLVPQDEYLPILVLTADVSVPARQRALSGGAHDFLTKPFDVAEVQARIRNLLETRRLHGLLRNQNRFLEERVRERTSELEGARVEILERLALAAEYRDDDTGEHTRRVGRLAASLGRAAGLPEREVELIRRAAPLHDVGKIGVPDVILLKPGKLTPEEFDRMKTHAAIGGKILSGSRFPMLRMAEEIALGHHENWDGSGYPRGLKAEGIPLAARLTAFADVLDALVNERPYKEPWPREKAIEEIRGLAGRKFDPALAAIFVREMADEGFGRETRIP